MRIDYYKEFSPSLGRDMEFKVYGHGGKPALVFPCQNGRFFDWEGFGMLETLGDYLEDGKLQLFTVDTIDAETVSLVEGNPYDRVRRHWLHPHALLLLRGQAAATAGPVGQAV